MLFKARGKERGWLHNVICGTMPVIAVVVVMVVASSGGGGGGEAYL
jgi:hypothetical protein